MFALAILTSPLVTLRRASVNDALALEMARLPVLVSLLIVKETPSALTVPV